MHLRLLAGGGSRDGVSLSLQFRLNCMAYERAQSCENVNKCFVLWKMARGNLSVGRGAL